MNSLRKTALVAGALYLVTFITSIPARLLYGPVRNDPNYILGAGADTQVLFAGFLDVVLALACIGTAVALYPVVKRQNEGIALGFVGARILEAAIIVSGVVSLLSVVTLRQAESDQMRSSPARRCSPATTGRSCSDPASCCRQRSTAGTLMYRAGSCRGSFRWWD